MKVIIRNQARACGRRAPGLMTSRLVIAKLDQYNGFLVQVSCYRSTRRRKWNRNIRAASSSDPQEALLENARKCST